jgi:hypothetical protein
LAVEHSRLAPRSVDERRESIARRVIRKPVDGWRPSRYESSSFREEARMSASTAPMAASTSAYNAPAFWERLWRSAGIQFVVFFVVTCAIYGQLPGVGASAAALESFYGDRTRILVATALSGLNVLNLLWFAAAVKATLADAGLDGWGSASTASSAAFGALFFLLITIGGALAYSMGESGNRVLLRGVHDLGWALIVLSSFPRAMLIMSWAFGLWRARLISSALFAVGIAALVLVLLGGTTWVSGGFWAPDGAYSRFVSPLICLTWIIVVSGVLLRRSPATRSGW